VNLTNTVNIKISKPIDKIIIIIALKATTAQIMQPHLTPPTTPHNPTKIIGHLTNRNQTPTPTKTYKPPTPPITYQNNLLLPTPNPTNKFTTPQPIYLNNVEE
jgi:hypothetical protein